MRVKSKNSDRKNKIAVFPVSGTRGPMRKPAVLGVTNLIVALVTENVGSFGKSRLNCTLSKLSGFDGPRLPSLSRKGEIPKNRVLVPEKAPNPQGIDVWFIPREAEPETKPGKPGLFVLSLTINSK